jgi:trk system potassium uptake protein
LARTRAADATLIIGLGRFGASMAEALVDTGHEVLAVDHDLAMVELWSGKLTHVVQADSTNEDAMRQLGAADFQTAVVGIGTHIEASLLTAAVLVDLGVHNVWAKAISKAHGRILERIGCQHVVYPEFEMGARVAGARVAHLLTGKMIDYIEFDDGFAIVKMRAPAEVFGKTLGEAALRSKYGVTIVGVKRRNEDFTYATPDTRVARNDLLIVSGRTELVEKFAIQAL